MNIEIKHLWLHKCPKKWNQYTLIALVITIIVLLILAGVTIATLTGDNGLLQKATSTKEENEDSKELELIKLAVSAAQVTGEGNLTKNNLENELNGTIKEVADGWIYNGYKINKDGKVERNLLPKEYQQVEYIESSGTQYIDTLVFPSNNTYLSCTIRINDLFDKHNNIAGSRVRDSSLRFGIITSNATKKFGFLFGEQSNNNVIKVDTELHKFELDKSGFKCDNEIKQILNNEEFFVEYTIWLFGFHNDYENQYNSYKLYNCEIKNNNSKRNFIPCKSVTTVTNADGNPVPADTKGLYNLVEGKFYTNANTAQDAVDFIAGPEV